MNPESKSRIQTSQIIKQANPSFSGQIVSPQRSFLNVPWENVQGKLIILWRLISSLATRKSASSRSTFMSCFSIL